MSRIRVRFAPSPTGYLHIGSLRVALFNWLFARHNKGTFLVRIEDTDIERSKAEFTQSILDSLAWAGIESDEPIITQTERFALYKEKINWLLENHKAYRCFCPANVMTSQEDYFKYDGKCRIKKYEPGDESKPHVIRIKLPLEQKNIEFNDLIRGPISIETTQLDDFIIARTDGSPIYNFVVVVDDSLMNISHIIRGEDHISNTPKQIVLYNAFGWKIPAFAHLPLILGADGSKLSKRDAATAVTDYKFKGYLPEAFCNYLVRLGWAHGDQEIFTKDELINYFTLEAVGKKGAIFDQAKLDWVNSIYIKARTSNELFQLILKDIDKNFRIELSGWSEDTILKMIDLYKERCKTLKEIVQEIYALYQGPEVKTAAEQKKLLSPESLHLAKEFSESLQSNPSIDIGIFAKEFMAARGKKLGELTQPLRLALTGKTGGPGIFETVKLLGIPETVARIKKFVQE